MNKFFEHNLILIIQIIYIFIFGAILVFSLSYIINLWTYSEIHINYSQGFIRRGFLGQVITILTDLGLSKKKFFSFLFFSLSIINSFFFLKIIKNKIKNVWTILFFSFNPALIIFPFFDLGGFVRFEIFGIFLILSHTYLFIKTKENYIDINTYNKAYFYCLVPSIIISVLIHEVNLLVIFFHLATTYNLLRFKKIDSLGILIKYFSFLIILAPITIFFLSTEISEQTIQQMYADLPDKENVSLWIWNATLTNISSRSEFLYMTNPPSNALYYFFVFAFYFVPIAFVFKKNINFDSYKIITNILCVIPLLPLFYIGRDWGRWMHIIMMIIFCYNMQFIDKEKIVKLSYNKIVNFLFIFFIFFQISFTRIPHCCNLIEKKISIIGGALPKIIMLKKIVFKNINIQSRFKDF